MGNYIRLLHGDPKPLDTSFVRSQTACEAVYRDLLLVARASDGANAKLVVADASDGDYWQISELVAHREMLRGTIAAMAVAGTEPEIRQSYPRSGPLGSR